VLVVGSGVVVLVVGSGVDVVSSGEDVVCSVTREGNGG
jgi:hypothetical protein